ncbi:TPA: nitrite transporter, partial [Klebsiella pneumoniae]|nr:nitrite transporter [Klebsiella pneumoniae]
PQLDCFGIVNEIRRDLNLPVWPDFAGVTKDDGGLDREARRMMLTLERCEPCEGAGVACYSGSTVTHVGIVVSIDGLLHVAECNPGTNVTFLPLPRFKRRFVKVEFWQ